MEQLDMTFDAPRAHTRARRTDSDTSRQAAKFAATRKAEAERLAIYEAIRSGGPQTAREVAAAIGVDYIEVQRRISEVAGLTKTKDSRDGCRVWGIA
jgi:DNA-binding FadR family transcriptional regulator